MAQKCGIASYATSHAAAALVALRLPTYLTNAPVTPLTWRCDLLIVATTAILTKEGQSVEVTDVVAMGVLPLCLPLLGPPNVARNGHAHAVDERCVWSWRRLSLS